MAAGVKQTHVKGSKVDMNFLAEIAKKSNANDKVIELKSKKQILQDMFQKLFKKIKLQDFLI